MNKSSNIIRTMCEIGLFTAIGYILDELQGLVNFTNGGSIGIAMIAVLIVGYRRGGIAGILTGLFMGALDLLSKAYIYHPAQVLLDYILPYALVGCAGFLKPFFDKSKDKKEGLLWLISGAFIGGMLKFVSHFLAGIFFWGDPNYFIWNISNVYLYSFLYNIAFVGPSIILCIIILVLLYLKAPLILKVEQYEIEEKEATPNKPIYSWGVTILYIVGGLTAFIWCLIRYIQSVKVIPGDKITGDQDSVLIFVLGFTLLIIGLISLYRIIKKKGVDDLLSISFVSASGLATLYAVAKIIYLGAIKGKVFADYRLYIYWMIICFLLCGLGVIGLVNHIRLKKGEEI